MIDPDVPGSGQGMLDWPDAGSVGLVSGFMGAANCYLMGVGDDLDGSHTLSLVNEATVQDTFPGMWIPTYDAAGNLTSDKLYKYSYDAWNRLVQVTRQWPATSPQVIAEYAYDGLGRRIKKAVSHSGDRNGVQWFYYNHRWQLLQVSRGDTDATHQPIQQFVWGPNYIDEAICMDAWNGTTWRHFFYCQDANWNVTALLEKVGSQAQVIERYEYDPYGTVRIYKGYSADAGHELLGVTSESLKWLGAGLPGNPFLYCGYYYDTATDHYDVRRRPYSPPLGRWMTRDPAGYVDGMSLYQYVRSEPITKSDAAGLWGPEIHHQATTAWAILLGYPEAAAETVGSWDAAVDRTAVSKRTGWLPNELGGDQSYHFNQSPVIGGDSRLRHFADHLQRAKDCCDWMIMRHDDPDEAAKQLGIALHPLQDWVAHGDYNQWTPTRSLWWVHNADSPQTNLFALGKTDVSHYPDDPQLDAINGPDGRPAGAAMLYSTVSVYISDEKGNGGYMPVTIEYALYELGSRRITLTRGKTKAALGDFRASVLSLGGCNCREYFGLK